MSTYKSHKNCTRAAGFTLVELLVVFAIIAILAAIAVVAVFKLIGVQQANNTQLTIKTVSSLLDKHWRTVIKDHQNDQIPASIMAMAGNDPRRARVIWVYANLKREFPMNLTETLAPSALPNQLLTAALQLNPSAAVYVIQPTDLPPKKNYLAALTRAASIQGAVFTASSDPNVWPFESAFTLVMALQQTRGSDSFAEENFAANAMASELFTWTPGSSPPQRSANPFLAGPKMLVDAWGTPLAFYRFPVGNSDFQPNSVSPISASVLNAQYPNPLDPEGTLVDPRWNNFGNWSTLQGVWWFERYFHSIHSGSNQQSYVPRGFYFEPVIVSAGPDHILGIQPVGPLVLGSTTIPPSPTFPDEMNVVVLAAGSANDNISSYNLRQGGTGDK